MHHTTLNTSRTKIDTDFLDEKGYLILKDILSPKEVHQVKQKTLEILKTEAPRNGEFGYSLIRENLIQGSKKIQLFVFDSIFVLLKKLFRISSFIFPKVVPLLMQYRSKPFDYTKNSLFKRELRQIGVCIMEQYENPKDHRICDLVNKGVEFDIFYQHPKILALVKHIVGKDYKLSSLNHRSPQKNSYQQDLHVDYPRSIKGDTFYACNALYVLDDMDESNGATRVVPGSHRFASRPCEHMPDPKATHPDEIILEAKAGDVIFLNSHVWHGGTVNKSGKERAVIQSYFVHRSHTPQQFQQLQMRTDTLKRLSKQALEILDVNKSMSKF